MRKELEIGRLSRIATLSGENNIVDSILCDSINCLALSENECRGSWLIEIESKERSKSYLQYATPTLVVHTYAKRKSTRKKNEFEEFELWLSCLKHYS